MLVNGRVEKDGEQRRTEEEQERPAKRKAGERAGRRRSEKAGETRKMREAEAREPAKRGGRKADRRDQDGLSRGSEKAEVKEKDPSQKVGGPLARGRGREANEERARSGGRGSRRRREP